MNRTDTLYSSKNLPGLLAHYIGTAFDNEAAFLAKFWPEEKRGELPDDGQLHSLHMASEETRWVLEHGGTSRTPLFISTAEFMAWVDGMNKNEPRRCALHKPCTSKTAEGMCDLPGTCTLQRPA